MTSADEPIAIVGIGCRFPGGANGPDRFWQLLTEGFDAVTEVPADRWSIERYYTPAPVRPGKTISRWGAFVDGLENFDASFFGISPREAARIDPQHRMLLETAWEALEDGGDGLASEEARQMGVFVGIAHIDYSLLQSTAEDQTTIDMYSPTGTAHSIAANRISHCLDLTGPSVAFDTACSSSLTAAHYACQSLWRGECRAALTGGANVLITPTPFIGFSQASMLSPDGRCYAFDSRANGFVRGEGAGMMLLKPLSVAQADGDPIYALILGTALNQDGGGAALTVPDADAQQRLVTEACRRAGVSPGELAYVEAHGTGTPVGDPVEIRALSAALSPGRPDDEPCLVGSVKTNIGHLESAAGIAGLIKATLAVHHRQVPPHLNFREPSSHLAQQNGKLRICTDLEEMPRYGTRVLAGVNSFGFGGANAHAILAEPPAKKGPRRPAQTPEGAHLLPLSARSHEALRATAERWRDVARASGSGLTAADLCFTAGVRRRHHDHRLAVVGSSSTELARHLDEFVQQSPDDRSAPARPTTSTGLVFVCSGQGPQWPGMGRQLFAEEAVFRRTIEACEEALAAWADWSLTEELMAGGSRSRLNDTAIAQPAIFALQVALARLLESWGVVPAAIVGHSVGEVAAAHLAGALDLQTAARVIYHRGRTMQQVDAVGGMLAVGLPADQAETLAGSYANVHLAAVNSPSATTLGGALEELEKIDEALREDGLFCRFVPVSYPFHTPAMEPAAVGLEEALAGLRPRPAAIGLFSTVTGGPVPGDRLDAGYWADSVRRPVQFVAAIEALAAAGHELFLEISPHPALSISIRECLAASSCDGTVISSLRRDEPERATLLRALGDLYEAGADVAWKGLEPRGRPLRAPTYPWQKERHWHEAPAVGAHREPRLHPVLRRMDTAEPRWQGTLDPRIFVELEDHRILGRMIFPAAGYVELALAAARDLFGERPCVLEEVQFERALWIPDDGPAPHIQLSYSLDNGEFEIHARPEGGADWTRRVSGRLRELTTPSPPARLSVDALRHRCDQQVPLDGHYRRCRHYGLEYGPNYRTVQDVWRGDGASFGRIAAPFEATSESDGFRVLPSLLDGAAVTLAAGLRRPGDDDEAILRLPARLRRLVWHAPPGDSFMVFAELVHENPRSLEGNLRLFDDHGDVAIEIEGYYCTAGETTTPQVDHGSRDLLYELRWQLAPLKGEPPPCRPADYQPSPGALSARLQKRAEELERLRDLQGQTACDAALQRLAEGYCWAALGELGWRPEVGEQFTAEELCERLGIESLWLGRLEHCLGLMAAGGSLVPSAKGWKAAAPVDVAELADLWRSTLWRHPAARPELTLVGCWGRSLRELLTGARDSRRWLADAGEDETLAHFLGEGWRFRHRNLLLSEALVTALEDLPEGRRISILEIGASALPFSLSRLPVDQAEYTCCLASERHCAEAEERFRGRTGVRFQALDLDRSPAEQGLETHGFDVILGNQALRTAADPRRALGHLLQLLASEGLLLLHERVRPLPWMDLVFALGEPCGCAVDRDRLLERLARAGCSEISPVSGSERSDGALFLARGPVMPTTTPTPTPTPIVEGASSPAMWLLLADRGDVAERLAARLRRHGEPCRLVRPGERYRRLDDGSFEIRIESSEDYRQLVAQIDAGQARWVHLSSLGTGDLGHDDGNHDAFAQANEHGCLSAIRLLQALQETASGASHRLWLVTAGAQPAGREPACQAVAQAPLIGLGRVVANELPQLDCRRVDLGGRPDERELDALARELMTADGEPEVALRCEARYVQRLVRGVTPTPAGGPDGDMPYRLDLAHPGSFDNLCLRAAPRSEPQSEPQSGEVEVEVAVAALNFRDVMKVLGIYPAAGADALNLGDECAGRVAAVGPGVEGMDRGDEVLVLGAGCMTSRLRVPAEQVLAIPPGLNAEEAATLPIAFVTTWYALHHLARISRGERVLIHSATGGVGMAALQLARRAGCEIFATAGSEAKRAFLRQLGVEHVHDSRSLEFADEILGLTGGAGVDVVLNSLSGQAIDKGFEVLRPFGRFLELGKRDIHENRKLAMRLMKDNLAFFAVDLGQARLNRPELVPSILAELRPLFAGGELRPLPARVFPASDARSAFRIMARARHVGKLLLDFAGARPRGLLSALPTEPHQLRPDASYLVTGGLGGFGLEVADWMAATGARTLVLAGRRGAESAEAKTRTAALRERGVEVLVARCDISRSADVDALFERIDATLPPLAGIVHAAMVLDDATLTNLTPERFSRVMEPKARGAWHLHARARSRPLDFFVLFGSAAGVIGNPGQGNYAAANAFLDALAHYRRGLGLPALAIDWGVLGDVGVVAERQELQELLARQGSTPLAPRRATSILSRLLSYEIAQASVMAIDWRRFAEALPAAAASPRLEALVESQPMDRMAASSGARVRQRLLEAPAEERQEILEAYLCSKIGRALGLDGDELNRHESLLYLVTDSLVGVELATSIQSDLRVSMPLAQLLAGGDIEGLAAELLRSMEAR